MTNSTFQFWKGHTYSTVLTISPEFDILEGRCWSGAQVLSQQSPAHSHTGILPLRTWGYYEFISISFLCFLENIALTILGDLMVCRMLERTWTRGHIALLQGQRFLHVLPSLSASQWQRNENWGKARYVFAAPPLLHTADLCRLALSSPRRSPHQPQGLSNSQVMWLPTSLCTMDFEAVTELKSEHTPVLLFILCFPSLFPERIFSLPLQ